MDRVLLRFKDLRRMESRIIRRWLDGLEKREPQLASIWGQILELGIRTTGMLGLPTGRAWHRLK
jgi:hypothetical protein